MFDLAEREDYENLKAMCYNMFADFNRHIDGFGEIPHQEYEKEITDLKDRAYILIEKLDRVDSDIKISNYYQVMNTYYLENKENYDTEFLSLNDLIKFIIDSLSLNDQEIQFQIINDSFLSGTKHYSFMIFYREYAYTKEYYATEIKEFLLNRQYLSDDRYKGIDIKYHVNSKELIKFVKEMIFNIVMNYGQERR